MLRHTFSFFLLRVSSHSAKPPPVAILPSAPFVSDIRSVQGGCSRFSPLEGLRPAKTHENHSVVGLRRPERRDRTYIGEVEAVFLIRSVRV
jgi:hypothetical protein